MKMKFKGFGMIINLILIFILIYIVVKGVAWWLGLELPI